MRHEISAVCSLLLAAGIALSSWPARAVYWNDDPNTATFGVASASGLTDKPIWFPNDYAIYNDNNSTRGTSILLNSEWALTVHHVVQSSAGYNPITTPNFISVYVDGIGGYFADQLFVPSDGSEIALVHLRGGVNSALNLVPNINSSFTENGKIVQIGGYGYWGYVTTTNAGGTVAGTTNTGASFHRAYNTIEGTNGLGQLLINENHDATVAANNLLEGMAGPGDSGGPMFAFYGSNFATQANDMSQWRLVGLTATSGSATWGSQSQYTRVANFYNWINTAMASLPTPAASTTGTWVQDVGSNLYDTGRAKISVSNSSAAPVVHAKFGPGGTGYTLATVGDKITMTATLDTTLAMNNVQFRFGMFDDVGGTLPGNVAGSSAANTWRGYLVGNSIENAPQGAFEKGPNGGGIGQWWSIVNPNSGVLVNNYSTQATGSFTSASGGTDFTPAGVYNLTLTYTRVAGGLQIDWSMVQIADSAEVFNNATGLYQHNPTSGVYSFSGSTVDATPASSTWTYDELGYFLYGSSMTNSTIMMDNINVAFVPEPPSLALMGIAVMWLLVRMRTRKKG